MTDQLSADDWISQGLKALAKSGFTALKADPLAKAMGVSRGSFYWHFADLGASETTTCSTTSFWIRCRAASQPRML